MQVQSSLAVEGRSRTPRNGTTAAGREAAGDFRALLESDGQEAVKVHAAAAEEDRPGHWVRGIRWTDDLLAGFAGRFRGAAVDTSRTINWDSTGDHKLTGEEIKALREKYDVNNLTPQAYYDLISELTHMNVLSAEDIHSMHFQRFMGGLSPAEGAGNFYFTALQPSSGPRSHPYSFTSGDMMKAILHSLADSASEQDFMLSRDFWRLNPSVSLEEYQTHLGYLQDRGDRMNKLQSLFVALGR